MTALYILIVLTTMGALFGLLLAIANKYLKVETNPLIHEVDEILPKGQCGACGYAGCLAYAEAVVTNSDVSPNLCIPGKDEVSQKVAIMTGKSAQAVKAMVAIVKCAGNITKYAKNAIFHGVSDCYAASQNQGGEKICKYGCLGFGACMKICVFQAITMSPDRLPVIDFAKCTGCGQCVIICPRKIIELSDPDSIVKVVCSSKDKPAVSKKNCQVACIGCKLCAKLCSHNAITVIDNLAVVDTAICIAQCSDPVCLAKCSTDSIKRVVLSAKRKKELAIPESL